MEKHRVGLNGVGTIGREVLRQLERSTELEVVALNDVAPPSSLVSHLRRGAGWPLSTVEAGVGTLTFGGRKLTLHQLREPAQIPWSADGVELVIEASGLFTDASKAAGHLEGGALQVLVTAPSKGADVTVVRGVNDERLQPSARIVSAGSCTTNCVAPIVSAIDRGFGIEWGGFVSIHAATNDQSLVGAPGKEAARSYASLDNAFATSTGASRAIEEVLPALTGRLAARSVRVPITTGSRIELWARLCRETTSEGVLAWLEAEASNGLAGILGLSAERLAAMDIRGSTESALVEVPSIEVFGGRQVMLSAWYDNVSAFSCRVVELLGRMAAFARERNELGLHAAGY